MKVLLRAIATAMLMCGASVAAIAQQTETPATQEPAAGATPSAGPAPAATAPAGPPPASTAAPGAATQQPSANTQTPKLPEVQIIQEKPKPVPEPVQEAAPKPKKKPAPIVEAEPEPAPAFKPKKKVAAKPKPASKPQPVQPAAPESVGEPEPIAEAPEEPTTILQNSPYGAAASAAAAARAAEGPTSPINPQTIAPQDLSRFSSAATRVDTAKIDAYQVKNTNEVFSRVPGVHVVNDDGFGRHGGVGVRGSPPRRGRKVLHMEDGQPINLSVWIDPSVHYTPPIDRLDSIEVLRGTVISHGPLNNHGVVNFRNLSPFGPNESVISAAIGKTQNRKGSFTEEADDPGEEDETFTSSINRGISNMRHVHTRQMVDNVGLVFSYSGAEVDGTWDTERLRYNDFYGAVGWKGGDQDLTISAGYFRQRDDYDEANLEGEELGEAEDLFYNSIQWCKSCFNPGSRYNSYNADLYKTQLTHNYYVDRDTTVTSRLYGFHHRRDRYQNVEGEDPSEVEDDETFASRILTNDEGEQFVFLPEGVMLGRLRTYKQFGGEVRTEFANRPFVGGMTQDIQAGVRYEWNDFKNRNFFGNAGQILKDGDKEGVTAFERDYRANAVSGFLQTAIHLTPDFTLTPGLRLEHFRLNRKTKTLTVEEGEGEEFDDCAEAGEDEDDGGVGVTNPDLNGEECVAIPLAEGFADNESSTKTHVLPGVAMSYTGLFRSTVFGGYHRGFTPHVLREERFPPGDEIGDNFQLGLRSTAVRGLTFEVAGFYNRIQDFQIKGGGIDATGNNIYSTVDLVEVSGVELMGRVDSRAFVPGAYNLFFEGNYTFSNGRIRKGTEEVGEEDEEEAEIVNLAGNQVPEVPRHFATLTVGVEHAYWDVSASYTYRGAFFTDTTNAVLSEEGEDGLVPEVWLLSARANLRLGDTGASVFISGENLTNELYISDREDGIKPGQGRTIWGGFKYKF
jgi:Fe(3+) dicitrate transport protein